MFVLSLILLLLSSFFSCSETVLVTLNKFQIRKLIKTKKYIALRNWIENPSKFLIGILIGNSIVNIAFGSIFTFQFFYYIAPLKINNEILGFISFLISSIIILIFGEIIPKNLGRMKAHRLIHIIYKPLTAFIWILSPIIFLVSRIEKIFVNRTKIDKGKFTREDFHKFVATMDSEGYIKKDMAKMIHSFLELKKKKVYEIMVPKEKIEGIDISKDFDLYETIQKITKSRIPVYDINLDNILGILYLKDILSLWPINTKVDLKNILRSPLFIDKNMELGTLFMLFTEARIHLGLIMENGKVLGVVALEDILEEIIGEIFDEYDFKKLKMNNAR